ncbi:MAG: DUF6752 domain-containing protein [Nocardioidaceae bacterium]
MTERVYVHVGAPKSGTTYLQRVLEQNRGPLAEAGVLVVGESHLDLVHAGMAVRQDPRLADLPPRAGKAWQRLVDQIRAWAGPTAILSYELLGGASAEQVRRALADLDGLEVHVVVSARDFAKAVPSAWQEKLKFAFTTRLEDWRPRPEEDGPRAEWGWRTMDPSGVAARWGAGLPPEHVHIVTVPSTGAPRDELWRRFAAACSLDVPGLRTDVPRANESMSVVAAELLRRVNERIGAPITGNREQAVWIRDTLAHGVLAKLGREPIGLTEEQLADARERSAAAIATLSASGYDIQGDVEDLRASEVEARTPGQVTEAELLDTAVRAIVELLVLVRARSTPRRGERPEVQPAPAGAGVKGRLGRASKGMARAASGKAVLAENRRLQERLDELEDELRESRKLQLRVADLTDVVTELLLPAAQQDPEVSRAALERYRSESL